jgi:cytochrome c-type biogenesis protein CcmH
LFVVASSAGLYAMLGSPGLQNQALTHGGEPGSDMIEVVEALAKRLEGNPDDVGGWRMLGKSYMSLNNYPRAVAAFERVVELEDGRSAQGLVELGEALLAAEGGQTMPQRAMSLFENALAIEPNNQAALFWGGLGAVNRGDTSLAADRWERLLGTNPPEDIRDVIEQRVAEWRGEPAPPTAAAAQQPAESETAPEPAPLEAGAIVSASIALSEAAQSALPADATVFVIARDPSQPSPRVSLSGQPVSKPGDWFGSVLVKPAENGSIALSIDTPVE